MADHHANRTVPVEDKYSTREEAIARGKAARTQAPRSTHAGLDLRDRPDPIALLEEQARTRVPQLVPIRYGRMLTSPFAFFRGGALIMASDLSRTATSGLRTQLCGDAHLKNFGLFGTPERNLLFGVNDFDETICGPFEWDVKRLCASFEVAARENGFSKQDRREIVLATARTYREAMAQFATQSHLEVWYLHMDVETALEEYRRYADRRDIKAGTRAVASAKAHDSMRALEKLTHFVGSERRIVSNPPLIMPARELIGAEPAAEIEERILTMIHEYSESLLSDRRVLFERYRFIELALKVVGVGSVGTRCWVALFLGKDSHDPLFLQVKEAQPSVLERFVGKCEFDHQGQRVVHGQRLMQASSDLFLGWGRTVGTDGVHRDFYIRQLLDWKGSLVVEEMAPRGMASYGRMCGWTLARSHARAGDRMGIAAYLGRSETFDRAIATFAEAYADQNEQDYAEFGRAVRSGRLVAKEDI
jgi:uncharacterized protein (DUF2252 family)